MGQDSIWMGDQLGTHGVAGFGKIHATIVIFLQTGSLDIKPLEVTDKKYQTTYSH